MVLHPQARAAVAESAGLPRVFEPGFDVDAARAAARELASSESREPVREVRDLDADGVRCRCYMPEDRRPGVVLHVHGGGFVFGDIETHDPSARRLANRSRRTVVSVDYRRPPEHRFPAAPDDVDTVARWVSRQSDPALAGPVAVHGDSAGGNLALVAALRHPERFAAVALVYPFLDPGAQQASYRTECHGFDPREAEWYWEQYAASAADLADPDLAPLRSDRLHTLPPTLVVTAEHDPLRDEGEQLAAELAEAGVSVEAVRWLGQVHGFWRFPEVFDAAEPLMRHVAGFLDARLNAASGRLGRP